MPGIERAFVDISPEDYAIVAVSIDDGMGNTTMTRLSKVEVHQDLDDGQFTFTPPEGVQVTPFN